MAKIEKSITYNGHICSLRRQISNLSFYSCYDDDAKKLLIVDNNDNVLAVVTPSHTYCHGIITTDFNIEKE